MLKVMTVLFVLVALASCTVNHTKGSLPRLEASGGNDNCKLVSRKVWSSKRSIKYTCEWSF